MAKVRSFEVSGCTCRFYAGDHGPPHFHAASPDEWEIRVFFLKEPVEYQVKYELRKIPRNTLKELLSSAARHRAELFEEWEGHRADD